MRTVVDELRLKTVSVSRVPPKADLSVASGDLERVFRQKFKPYVGNFQIIWVENLEVQFSNYHALPKADYDDIVNVQKLVDMLHRPYSIYVLLAKAESDEMGTPQQIF